MLKSLPPGARSALGSGFKLLDWINYGNDRAHLDEISSRDVRPVASRDLSYIAREELFNSCAVSGDAKRFPPEQFCVGELILSSAVCSVVVVVAGWTRNSSSFPGRTADVDPMSRDLRSPRLSDPAQKRVVARAVLPACANYFRRATRTLAELTSALHARARTEGVLLQDPTTPACSLAQSLPTHARTHIPHAETHGTDGGRRRRLVRFLRPKLYATSRPDAVAA
jgi:hypothetical protein